MIQTHLLTTPGRPCDEQGNFLPPDARPPARSPVEDYTPFENRPAFHFAELMFKRIQASIGNIDDLLRALAAYNVTQNGADTPFDSAEDLLSTIDMIPYGDAPWESFSVRYTGAVDEDSPSWKRAEFVVHCRNARTVTHNIIGTEEFNGKFDFTPYQEYLPDGSVCYSNLMSGEHAYTQAVRFFCHLLVVYVVLMLNRPSSRKTRKRMGQCSRKSCWGQTRLPSLLGQETLNSIPCTYQSATSTIRYAAHTRTPSFRSRSLPYQKVSSYIVFRLLYLRWIYSGAWGSRDRRIPDISQAVISRINRTCTDAAQALHVRV